MIVPTFDIEAAEKGTYDHIVGIDEAGRGPWAGPVVAAAARYRDPSFAIPKTTSFRLIRDSKTIPEYRREEAYALVSEFFDVGVGIVDAATIDRLHILKATFLAMRKALDDLCGRKEAIQEPVSRYSHKTLIVVDGNQLIPELSFSVTQMSVIGGDARSYSIAAASIAAKVIRDRLMRHFDSEYPNFGFAQHKGYGTRIHQEALRRYGPSPLHRLSFAPVARVARLFAKSRES